MTKAQKQINAQIDELNGVIHRRNLYANGRRYIYAHEINGVLCVQDLHTEKPIAVSTLGKLFDGYGQEVILETIPGPTELKFTKTERFILANFNTRTETIATQLGKTPAAIDRAVDRVLKKTSHLSAVELQNLCAQYGSKSPRNFVQSQPAQEAIGSWRKFWATVD